jgi:hypothetical protein
MFPKYDAALDTIRKIQELDAADECLVIIAHDLSLRDKIPMFPDNINGWRAGSIKAETRWLFYKDLVACMCHTDKAVRE